jgi:hypothetical protein
MRNYLLPVSVACGVVAVATSVIAQEKAGACAHDRQALLALDIRSFDKTLGQGWRLVGNRKGCEADAADLIAAYRMEHSNRLVDGPVDNLRGLLRHESQLRAAAGQIDRAIRLRQNARENGDRAQQLYDDATIAFLKKDREKLEEARRELVALPRPSWHEEAAARTKAQHGMEVSWPPNLDVIDGLRSCFDRPYAEAYSAACREKAAK